MIVSAYKYFSGTHPAIQEHRSMSLRQQVATALGIAESTVGSIIADWNCRNDGSFTPHQSIGRPIKKTTADLAEILRHHILTGNAAGRPLSTIVLRQLLEDDGFILSK